MAFGGPNPGIWGDAVRKALNPTDERNARDQLGNEEQRRLDQAELREFERSGSYDGVSAAQGPSRLRRAIQRLFRRSA